MNSIRDVNVKNKRVLLRADFNVSLGLNNKIDEWEIWRIKAALPTIEYLLKNKAKVILISHFGEPEGEIREELRLDLIKDKLAELLNVPLKKSADCIGEETEKLASQLAGGEALLLENLRFHPGEEANAHNFAKELARLGDIYVNDAFAVSHRRHASLVAITQELPSFTGFLLEKEIQNLNKILREPISPLTVIIGGAKISTKIEFIEAFLKKAQNIILGGALANSVLHAKGFAIGRSFVEEKVAPQIKKIDITNPKLHLPVDAVVSADKEGGLPEKIAPIGRVEEDDLILDIGPDTQELFSRIISKSKMIVWNGPMGFFEVEKFCAGTRATAEAIIKSNCFSVVGGGETVAFVQKQNLADKFSWLSTGGGAMLEFLSGKKLPGIEALEKSI